MTLLCELYAFFHEHRRCGELDRGVEGEWVSATCTCGATIPRQAPLTETSFE